MREFAAAVAARCHWWDAVLVMEHWNSCKACLPAEAPVSDMIRQKCTLALLPRQVLEVCKCNARTGSDSTYHGDAKATTVSRRSLGRHEDSHPGIKRVLSDCDFVWLITLAS